MLIDDADVFAADTHVVDAFIDNLRRKLDAAHAPDRCIPYRVRVSCWESNK
jgi:DNA-binding response OmpR family regulator